MWMKKLFICQTNNICQKMMAKKRIQTYFKLIFFQTIFQSNIAKKLQLNKAIADNFKMTNL